MADNDPSRAESVAAVGVSASILRHRTHVELLLSRSVRSESVFDGVVITSQIREVAQQSYSTGGAHM